jgi:hypothetical protein
MVIGYGGVKGIFPNVFSILTFGLEYPSTEKTMPLDRAALATDIAISLSVEE